MASSVSAISMDSCGESSPQRKRREVRVTIIVVLALHPLEERHYFVGGRCHDHFPRRLEQVLGNDDTDQLPRRPYLIKRERKEQRGVNQLSTQGRADDACPQPAP